MVAKSPSRKKLSPGMLWFVRALVAVVIGFAIGFGTGIVAVNKLEPGNPGQTDSLELMLDSVRRQEAANDPIRIRRAADSAAAAERNRRIADSTRIANDPNSPVVPNVVGLEEGAAREALELAGLEVGSIQFQASLSSAGTVLATSPKAELRVRLHTPVDLVLSDGRPPVDSFPFYH